MAQIFNIIDGYSYPVYEDMNRVEYNVSLIVEKITNLIDKSENIQLFCRGTSGLTISTVLCRKLFDLGYDHVKIAFVRKPTESSHSNGDVAHKNSKIIIVDDFISSGNTIKAILDVLESQEYPDEHYNYLKFNAQDNIIGFCVCRFDSLFKTEDFKNLKFVIQ